LIHFYKSPQTRMTAESPDTVTTAELACV